MVMGPGRDAFSADALRDRVARSLADRIRATYDVASQLDLELEKIFDERGIRYWRDVRHATAGRMEKVVDQAIRLNPTVLLVLSSSSVESAARRAPRLPGSTTDASTRCSSAASRDSNTLSSPRSLWAS